jgi:hypothetical protein
MDDLRRQVKQARRRLLFQRFLKVLPWTWAALFLIAAIAIAIPKVWAIGVVAQAWAMSWLAGALAGGLLLALAITYWRRGDILTAAIELDHRFGLKERVSSCLSLNAEEQASPAGQALIADAIRRVSKVEVGERFRVSADRWTLLPVGLATVAFCLTLLSDAQPDPNTTAQAAAVDVKKRVQNSTESLKKRLEERRQQALEKGLEEAGDLFKKLEQGVDSLKQKDDVDRQKALVKLNDLAQELQQRQKELLDRNELQKQLNSLKDIKQGPADKLAKAMKQGDFQTAMDEVKKLQEQMSKGEMSADDAKKLQEQMQQMRDKLQDLAKAHEQAKQDLQQQMEQKLAQGDRQAASDLQNKLDQMMQRDKQMSKMQEMAEKLGQCSQSMQQGEMQDAAGQLGDIAASLEGMQQEMAEMEMLEDALDQLASTKDAMNCQSCNGMGCAQCQGSGMGQGQGQGQGNGQGMGEGQGQGDRPEEQTGTGFYDSQVRSQPGQGKAVVSGIAFGPNKPGEALEEVKAEIESGRRSSDDPLTNQRLPKPQRELTREYFDAFRQGE